jgi:hypothetical protein
LVTAIDSQAIKVLTANKIRCQCRSDRSRLPSACRPAARGLLRTRRQRPSSRAAEKRYHVAAFHSITSSAMARSDCGTARPNAMAACRLIKPD